MFSGEKFRVGGVSGRWWGLVAMAAGVVLVVGGLSIARAQEVPKVAVPEFVPFVVDKANYDAVRKYLGGLKFDEAAPVVNWLDTMEARAKEQWLADNKPKEGDGK